MTLIAKNDDLNQSVQWHHYQSTTCRKLLAASASLTAFLVLIFDLSLLFELSLFLELSFVQEFGSKDLPVTVARPRRSGIPSASSNFSILVQMKVTQLEHQC